MRTHSALWPAAADSRLLLLAAPARRRLLNIVEEMAIASGMPVPAVYVIEISTVMMQVSWFKWTKRRYGEGRRIFPSTPIHHGFHMMGWKETQIVTRSYIVSAVAVVIALVTLKIR
jgi:phospho-N-acetylmuramoyl-pentapeptide-transferase